MEVYYNNKFLSFLYIKFYSGPSVMLGFGHELGKVVCSLVVLSHILNYGIKI